MAAAGNLVQQSTGIQQLLAAEKRAAEKVAEARKRKARRLKEAKEEATAEIEAYKQEREKQYRAHEEAVLGSKGDMEARVAESTRVKIDEVGAQMVANKEKAMTRLLDLVCDIKPEMHKNVRVQGN